MATPIEYCVKFNRVEVTIIRHVESEYNSTSIDSRDCGITHSGKLAASRLIGYYDFVLVSPLRRALQTLKHSKITYGKVVIVDLLREHKLNECDFLEGEQFMIESETDIIVRVCQFRKLLLEFIASNLNSALSLTPNEDNPNKKILLITHADFVWYLTSKIQGNERFGKWLDCGESLEYDPNS